MNFRRILYSRRAFTAIFAITCLTIIALHNRVDTSMSIASVAIGLAAANSHQKRGVPPEKFNE